MKWIDTVIHFEQRQETGEFKDLEIIADVTYSLEES